MLHLDISLSLDHFVIRLSICTTLLRISFELDDEVLTSIGRLRVPSFMAPISCYVRLHIILVRNPRELISRLLVANESLRGLEEMSLSVDRPPKKAAISK